jgi:hypothetical protein
MPARPDPRRTPEALAAQRRRAVRTAVLVGAVALGVYVAFLLSGVLNA